MRSFFAWPTAVKILCLITVIGAASCPQSRTQTASPNPTGANGPTLPALVMDANPSVFPPLEARAGDNTQKRRSLKEQLAAYGAIKRTNSEFSEPYISTRGFCDIQNQKPLIDIYFSDLMVTKAQLKKRVDTVPVMLSPAMAGEFRWHSEHTLRFIPATGWRHGVNVKVTVKAGMKNLKGMALAKDFSKRVTLRRGCDVAGKLLGWDPVKGAPQLVAMMNCSWYGESSSSGNFMDLTRGDRCLIFDQAVSPAGLKKMVTAWLTRGKAKATKLPFTLKPVTKIGGVRIPKGFGLALRITRRLKVGDEVRFTFDKRLVGQKQLSDKYDHAHVSSTSYKVPSPISVKKVGCSYNNKCQVTQSGNNFTVRGVRGRLELSLTGSMKYYNDKDLKKFVVVTPKPRKFSLSGYGDSIYLYVTLDPTRTYTLRLKKGLMGSNGYTSEKETRIAIVPAPARAAIKMPTDQVMEPGKVANLKYSAINLGEYSLAVAPADGTSMVDRLKELLSGASLGGEGRVTIARRNQKRDSRWHDYTLGLKKIAARSKKSLYFVQLTGSTPTLPEGDPRARATIIQVTDLAVGAKVLTRQSLFWVTSLSTGGPVAGAKVTILGVDKKGRVTASVAQGVTDASGLFVVKSSATAEFMELYVLVDSGKHQVIHRHQRSRAITTDKFKMGYGAYGTGMPAATRAMIFTERGIYKPGEKVHFKGLFRREIAGRLSPLKATKVVITLKDPRGKSKKRFTLPLTPFGTASATWSSLPSMTTGEYTLEAKVAGSDTLLTRTFFLLTPFRRPKFVTKIELPQSSLTLGQKAIATLSGHYLFGAPMKGAQVTWSLSRAISWFTPKGFDGFTFTMPHNTRRAGQVTSGSGSLDAEGTLKLAHQFTNAPSFGPMRYRFEADVQDIDRQVISAKKSFVVHPSVPYAGVRLVAPMVGTTKPVTFETVAVQPDGTRRPNQPLTAKIYKRTWYWAWETNSADSNQQMHEGYRDKLAHTCRLTKGSPYRKCTTRFKKAGLYVIRVTSGAGAQSHTAELEFYVSGYGDTGQKRSPFRPLGIKLKKKILKPGEMGQVMIPSPYKAAQALVTVERHGVLYKKVVPVKQGITWVSFPITRAMVPNGFVGVYLVRGREGSRRDAAGRDMGAAQYRLGYTPFTVSPAQNRLSVKVGLSKGRAEPGDKVRINVATAYAGKGTATEVALFVVDEGVLSLTAYKTPSPLGAMFKRSGLRLWVTDSRKSLLAAFNALYAPNNPGGGGGDDEGAMENGSSAKPVTRKNFKNTLYWNPALVTDSQGRATVTITMPDNLTTFRVMAVALDAADRFGKGENKVVVKKPFMLEPALPRFLTVGDRVSASVVAHNQTDRELTASVALKVQGVQVRGALVKSVRLAPRSSREVKYPIEVTAPGTVRFSFTGRPGSGVTPDAVSMSIPSNPVTVWQRHQVQGAVKGAHEIALKFPAGTIAEGSEFTIELSKSSLTSLRDGLDYLVKYPYGCVEQTTSSTYPLLALLDLFPAMGVTKHSPEKLRKMAQMGINRLAKMRTGSGGLAYWPGGRSPHLYGSAYAMLALTAAKTKGLTIPDDFHLDVARYLRLKLMDAETPLDLQAYIVYVLSKTKEQESAHLGTLYGKRKGLSLYGKAMLLMAMKAVNKGDVRVETLSTEVAGAFTSDGELKPTKKKKQRDYYLFSSELKTKAAALMALIRAGSSEKLVVTLAKGIMSRRNRGYWYTTQQTIYALMALSEYARHTNPGGDALRVSLSLNGKSLDGELKTISRVIKRHTFNLGAVLKGGGGKLLIRNRGSSRTPVFYTIRARYAMAKSPGQKVAVSKGISMYKRIERLSGKELDPAGVKGGELVRVRLFLWIPYNFGSVSYLAVNDPLPAGLEALDPRLATSSSRPASGSFAPYLARNTRYYISHSELRDERVLFFADAIRPGLHEFTYLARATTLGRFEVPPTFAEAMYDPEVLALSESTSLTVR